MREPEGVSTHYVLGAFFAVVLLCAVFFSLGYFLGYREGNPSGAPVTQQVAASSDAPTPVNASSQPSSAEPAATPSASEQTGSAPTGGEPGPAGNGGGSGQTAGAGPGSVPATGSAATARPQPDASPSRTGSSAADSSVEGGTDEDESPPGPVPPGLLIQVGAVIDRQQAYKMEETLRSKGYPALVLTPRELRASDAYLRIVVGPYKTRGAASVTLRKLAMDGYKPFIRQ
jgi:DedD protein